MQAGWALDLASGAEAERRGQGGLLGGVARPHLISIPLCSSSNPTEEGGLRAGNFRDESYFCPKEVGVPVLVPLNLVHLCGIFVRSLPSSGQVADRASAA